MRPKLVLSVLAVALLIAVVAAYVAREGSPPKVESNTPGPGLQRAARQPDNRVEQAAVHSSSTAATAPAAEIPTESAAGVIFPPTSSEVASPASKVKDDIAARIAMLQKLARTKDAQSLEIILSELTHKEKAVREEAREAAIQFGSRDAIPRIKEVAAMTEDPYEKVELLEAADFLALPTLGEFRARVKQRQALQAAAMTNEVSR